jgi:plastocyanin
MRAVVLTLLVACDSGSNVPVDAAPDVAIVPVVALSSCPGAVEATIQDSPTTFVPKQTTIPKAGTVKFEITGDHFVLPNTLTTTDQMLSVKRGETKCFRFNVSGTYGFLCGAHGFTGTIVVQ